MTELLPYTGIMLECWKLLGKIKENRTEHRFCKTRSIYINFLNIVY